MKKLLVLALTVVMASSAFAVVDEGANMLGFYFDATADTYCTSLGPYLSVDTHVILTNPDFDNLYGIEFGYEVSGNAMVLSTAWDNPQALDVGSAGNHIVGFGSPSPCSPATLVATLSVMNLDPTSAPIGFSMMPSNPSSNELGLPTALLADGVLLPLGFSTIDGVHCAEINGACDIVTTDAMTFDSVKSLYR